MGGKEKKPNKQSKTHKIQIIFLPWREKGELDEFKKLTLPFGGNETISVHGDNPLDSQNVSDGNNMLSKIATEKRDGHIYSANAQQSSPTDYIKKTSGKQALSQA